MRRRLLASLAATTAVAASLLIGSAGSATAAPEATADSVSAASRGSGGVTPNATLKKTPIYVDDTQFKIVATLRGSGKQVYDCGTDGKYKLREPVATLSTLRGAPAGIHGKGPFWANFDGSRVEGVTDPAPASVPQPPPNVAWLKITGTNNAGTGVFSKVAFIQRLDTKGGVAPASCSGSSTVSVDYSANYVFWAPKSTT